jgi:GTP cyclohydrolase II
LAELKQVAAVDFPTRWAQFRLLAFQGACAVKGQTALTLIAGDIQTSAPVVRIHSQCTTGDVFHSLRCDCHDQLHLAMRTIADAGAGILIYEHQEGRGIGLIEKLKAYELQDQGLDTIEANLRLGHASDLRDYRLAVDILHWLKVRSVRLITNNPDKIAAVCASGIEVVERLSAEVPIDPFSAAYMRTKREKLGHICGLVPAIDPRHAAEASTLPVNPAPRVGAATLF